MYGPVNIKFKETTLQNTSTSTDIFVFRYFLFCTKYVSVSVKLHIIRVKAKDFMVAGAEKS